MSEASLRAACVNLFRQRNPQAVVFRHEDSLRAGIPDTSISWRAVTSFWEFKYADPHPKWRGAQGAELQRMHSTGIPAFYVIYYEAGPSLLQTLIVTPDARYREMRTDRFAEGFNHRFVSEFIERIHNASR